MAAVGSAKGAGAEPAQEWERAWGSSARQAAQRPAPAHAVTASADASGAAAGLAPATPEQLDGDLRAPAPQLGAGAGEADLAALVRGSPFVDLDSPMTAYEWGKALVMVRPRGSQPLCQEVCDAVVAAALAAKKLFQTFCALAYHVVLLPGRLLGHQLWWLPALQPTCSGVAWLLRGRPCICSMFFAADFAHDAPAGSVALQPSPERAPALGIGETFPAPNP